MKKFINIDEDLIFEEFEATGTIKPVVGMGATYTPCTDEYPHVIVRVISDKEIVVQELNSVATKEMGIYTNDMEYFYNPNGETKTLTKFKNGWKQTSKEIGSWVIGLANRSEDPTF